MRLFRHPRWQHLDYRVKVATTQENKPPTQGTRQWTFTTPRWRCGSILLPSLNAGVPEPTGGQSWGDLNWRKLPSIEWLTYKWNRFTGIIIKCCYQGNNCILFIHLLFIHLFFKLMHWGQDKMADIFQTTVSKVFSWMKIYMNFN